MRKTQWFDALMYVPAFIPFHYIDRVKKNIHTHIHL